MIGFGRPRRGNALDELKERLNLPELKSAEKLVRDFYEGRNPFEHIKTEWPGPYAQYVRGFAYALERCKKDGIIDWARQENIATMTAIGLTRIAYGDKEAA